MKTVRTVPPLRRAVRAWKREGERVAFVPTMGYLHEGHLSLLRLARRRAPRVVASIFVNPTQFGPSEDFTRYPRDLDRDLRLCRLAGADLVYVPETADMYAADRRTEVRVTGLEDLWEGASRPGHFVGVALVVLKLLHRVEPDLLVLGQKDAQQAVVLETMIRDLDLAVQVVRGATVREPDGLALSSRNVYLTPEERRAAVVLSRALRAAEKAARGGERSARRLRSLVERTVIAEPLARLDYAAVLDARTLEPLRDVAGRVLIPVAAFFGRTRLIDNVEFTLPPMERSS